RGVERENQAYSCYYVITRVSQTRVTMMKENEAGLFTGTRETSYGIGSHQHLFAAWAASRAASVKGCRFKVRQGRMILEECGFNADFCGPEERPTPAKMDEKHLEWRDALINAAKSMFCSHFRRRGQLFWPAKVSVKAALLKNH